MCCSVLQRVAACCSVLQCVLWSRCATLETYWENILQHTAAHDSVMFTAKVLQHTSAHCNTLQHMATHAQLVLMIAIVLTIGIVLVMCYWLLHFNVLQCVYSVNAVCCSALQCAAVCCSVLRYAVVCIQCVALRCSAYRSDDVILIAAFQCAAVCIQCAAVCMQCVAVCCSAYRTSGVLLIAVF